MKDGFISIIVPVYQAEKYIEGCIKTIQNQTYKNLEIIVVDDGSKDKTPELIDNLAKKDNRIVSVHQRNQGVSAARNKGIEIATGEFVLFVDSDDKIKRDMCQKLYEEYCLNKTDLVIGGLCFCSSNNKETYTQNYNTVFDKNELLMNFEQQGNTYVYQNVLGKLYRTELVKKCSFPLGIRLGEDMMFNYIYFSYITKVSIIDYYGYMYNSNPGSATRRFDASDFKKQLILYDKGIDYYRKVLNGKDYPNVVEQNYVGNILGIIVCLVTNCDMKESIFYLKEYLNDEFFYSKLRYYKATGKKFEFLKQMCLKKNIFLLVVMGLINRMRLKTYMD